MENILRIRDGFPGQVQFVIPRSIVDWMKKHPMLASLMLTDIGWYPHARYHYRERHSGAQEHILISCVNGEGWLEIDGEYIVVTKNQAILIPGGKPHRYGASQENPWSIYWVHFSGSNAGRYLLHLPQLNYQLPLDADTVQVVDQLFRECFSALKIGFTKQNLIYSSHLLYHLFGRIIYFNQNFSPGAGTSQFHSFEETLVFMQKNIHRKLTLDEMAASAGFSTSHFSTLFKKQTGHSPVEYFIQLKVRHACDLLAMTQEPIHGISLQVGYEDPYYFSRLFRKVMGISPKGYRESVDYLA